MERVSLTFILIIDNLNCKIIRKLLANENQEIERVKLLDINQKQFEKDVVYIGAVNNAENIKYADINAILCAGSDKVPGTGYSPASNIALVDNDNIAEILSCVQDFIYNYHKLLPINQELMNTLLNNDDILSVVNKCNKIFNNPIAVMDSSFKLLAWSKEEKVDDPCWNEIVENGYPSIDTMVTLEKQNCIKNLDSPTKPIMIEPGNRSGFRKILVRIQDGKNTLGYIGVVEMNQKLSNMDLELVSLSSKILAKMFLYTDIENNKCDNDRYERIIIEILDKKLTSENQINERLHYLKWRFYKKYYMLAIDMSEKDNSEALSCYMKSSIKKKYPSFNMLIYDKHIIIIDGFDNTLLKPDTKYLEPLRELLKKSELYCGLSNCFGDLSQLNMYYKQSKLAMELGQVSGKYDTNIYYYSDYALMYMIHICSKHEDLNYFCNPAIIQLYEYDKEKGTHYLETLEAYVNNYKNYQLAAEAVYLHRNTMVYRINKIREITGLTLDDSEMMDLRMSFEIFRYNKHI